MCASRCLRDYEALFDNPMKKGDAIVMQSVDGDDVADVTRRQLSHQCFLMGWYDVIISDAVVRAVGDGGREWSANVMAPG